MITIDKFNQARQFICPTQHFFEKINKLKNYSIIMKDVIKKSILHNINKAILILERKKQMDVEAMKKLSDQAIEDVALYKDLDVVSMSVLFYSIYKVVDRLDEESFDYLINGMDVARVALQKNNFGMYNKSIKNMFTTVRGCNAKVKEHFQDVMDAARIKKGAVLLQKGLSLGQAAGLMGLSNWDLQEYAGRTVILGAHTEKIQARTRLETALRIFGV